MDSTANSSLCKNNSIQSINFFQIFQFTEIPQKIPTKPQHYH